MDKQTKINNLKRQVQQLRQQSLEASRASDYRRIAKLTSETRALNTQIQLLEGEREAEHYGYRSK